MKATEAKCLGIAGGTLRSLEGVGGAQGHTTI